MIDNIRYYLAVPFVWLGFSFAAIGGFIYRGPEAVRELREFIFG